MTKQEFQVAVIIEALAALAVGQVPGTTEEGIALRERLVDIYQLAGQVYDALP